MKLAGKLRQWLGHASTKAAIALVVVGVLFLLVQVQSPSMLYWTGQQVQGTLDGGIVYYRVHGEEYTLDNTGRPLANGTKVTLYVDRADPDVAMLQRPTKWVDAVTVLSWFAAAIVCVVVGEVRRARRRRRILASGPTEDWLAGYRSRAQDGQHLRS